MKNFTEIATQQAIISIINLRVVVLNTVKDWKLINTLLIQKQAAKDEIKRLKNKSKSTKLTK